MNIQKKSNIFYSNQAVKKNINPSEKAGRFKWQSKLEIYIFKDIQKILDLKKKEKFLDIGCGYGANKYATTDSGSLGKLKFNELPSNIRSVVKKMNKNEISDVLETESENFQLMLCDVKKTKTIIPSKFKITEILMNKKLDTIARQYMSELRTKAIIDVRI